jgi:hypothetical protein
MVCEITNVRDAGVETCWLELWNVRPRFGRSVMRSRKARTAASGFSQLNGLSFWLSRIGSVNCEQRQANATTRKSRRSLYSLRCLRSKQRQSGVSVLAGLDCFWNAVENTGSAGWSSRPRPANRLQATSQPRRVMRGGSKAMRLAPKEQDRPVCLYRQGKRSLFQRNSLIQLTLLNLWWKIYL